MTFCPIGGCLDPTPSYLTLSISLTDSLAMGGIPQFWESGKTMQLLGISEMVSPQGLQVGP